MNKRGLGIWRSLTKCHFRAQKILRPWMQGRSWQLYQPIPYLHNPLSNNHNRKPQLKQHHVIKGTVPLPTSRKITLPSWASSPILSSAVMSRQSTSKHHQKALADKFLTLFRKSVLRTSQWRNRNTLVQSLMKDADDGSGMNVILAISVILCMRILSTTIP